MNKHVLMLSRYFPPAFDVGGKRAYRFARYLENEGWDASLLVGPPPGHGKVDDTPLELPSSVTVHEEIYPPDFTTNRERFSDGTVNKPIADAAAVSPLISMSRRVRAQFRMPVGDDVRFTPHVVRRARAVHEVRAVDVVWATSAPYSVLVYGAAIKAALGIPLVLDLRDPWTPNFLAKRAASWRHQVECLIEQGLFTYADHVILNCEASLDEYRGLYPQLAPKMSAITNAFDPVQKPEVSAHTRPEDGFQIMHFGNCYGPRSAKDLLHAMRQVIDRRGLKAHQLSFLNLGRVAERDLKVVAELELEEFFSYQPFVPYEKGMEMLAKSDLQLLLAYGSETLFLPAKLYDYMLSGSDVLCIAEPSELTNIVDECGLGGWAKPGDVAGIAAVLERALDGAFQGQRNDTAIERFAAPHTTSKLAECFNAVC